MKLDDVGVTAVERLSLGPDDRLAVYLPLAPADNADEWHERIESTQAHVARWAGVEPERVVLFDVDARLTVVSDDGAA